MRISDWSSDVCSSDLSGRACAAHHASPWRADGLHADRIRQEPTFPTGCAARQKPGAGQLHRRYNADRCAGSGPRSNAVCGARFGEEPSSYGRSEEHTSELQSLMRISYAVFCLKKKKNKQTKQHNLTT